MSKRQELREIDEQKHLAVAKADLQRSTFMLLASPVFKVVQAAEVGVFSVRVGKRFMRYIKH